MNTLPRIGLGIDLHRLETGRRCVLGGVHFPESEIGPAGHSDADVILHAVCDALLGAAGEDDLGTLFPDTDAAHEGQDSVDFVRETMRRLEAARLRVASLDVVVECNRPKLSPRRAEMRARLADLVGAPPSHVNLKGKTGEKTGAIGRGEAIRATVVALLVEVG
jgi:2-C-methyl-D-erythritol 2,4-cyclodiphosphate synthase